MRIAICQLNPKHSEPEFNIALVNDWLSDFTTGDLDLIILPEMSFTGYQFPSLEEISPFLETVNDGGKSLNWAYNTALRLKCWVLLGVPIKERDKSYNTACIVNREGELIHIYKKHFLYELDETWASEGPSFESIELNEWGKVGFGICMDLNPYQFKSDFYLCEFANFQLSKKSKWVFCLMNWLESDPPTSSMIPYWIERLRPLDRTETTVLICNRLGKEKNNLFCGQSCLIQFTKNGIETSHCGKDEGLFLINV